MALKHIAYINTDSPITTDSNYFVIDASSNNITLTLPEIGSNGITFGINRVDTNANFTVTLLPSGTDTIDTVYTSKLINPNTTVNISSQNSTWYTNGNSGSGKEINVTFNHLWGSQMRPYVSIINPAYTAFGTFLYNGLSFYGSEPVKIEIIYSVDSDSTATANFTVQFQDITNAQIIATIGPINQTGSYVSYNRAYTTSFSNIPLTDALIEIDGKINSGTTGVRIYSVKLLLS